MFSAFGIPKRKHLCYNAIKTPRGATFMDKKIKALIREWININIDSDLFDPRFDYVAKRMLTHENPESKKALISLINASLELVGGETVVDLTIINPEPSVDAPNYKKSRFDIRVRFQNGEQGIIEIEWGKKDNFKKRAQLIISKAYTSQDISGKSYDDLKRCYLICIVDYTLFEDDKKYFRDAMFRDAKGTPLTDDQVIIFLELTKIKALLKKRVEDLTEIESWLIFFKYAADKSKREKLEQIIEKKEGIKMAAQILQTISMNERERALYESHLIYELDQHSALKSAEARGIAEGEARGEARGIAKGEARGIAKGEARGIAKGEARGKKIALDKFLELLQSGFTPEEAYRKMTTQLPQDDF